MFDGAEETNQTRLGLRNRRWAESVPSPLKQLRGRVKTPPQRFVLPARDGPLPIGSARKEGTRFRPRNLNISWRASQAPNDAAQWRARKTLFEAANHASETTLCCGSR